MKFLLVSLLFLMSFFASAQSDTVVVRLDDVYVITLGYDDTFTCKENQRIYIGTNNKFTGFIIDGNYYGFNLKSKRFLGRDGNGNLITEKIYEDIKYKDEYDIDWYTNFNSDIEPGFIIFIQNIDWIGSSFVISNHDLCECLKELEKNE